MRLFYSPLSPYARKARVTVIEKGLSDLVSLEVTSPYGASDALIAANPLSKVPAWVLDSGVTLYDSPVICEYLDSLAPAPQRLPPAGSARGSVLTLQALADGVIDAAFNLTMEGRRPEALRSADWTARWRAAILRGCVALDAAHGHWSLDLDQGQIASACALGYLDLRHRNLAWRESAPALSEWYAVVAQRPSFMDTAPPAG